MDTPGQKFRFLWKTPLSKGGPSLHVRIYQPEHPPVDAWLPANQDENITVEGSGPYEILAQLPSGRKFREVAGTGAAHHSARIRRIIIREAGGGGKNWQLHKSLGTVGAPAQNTQRGVLVRKSTATNALVLERHDDSAKIVPVDLTVQKGSLSEATETVPAGATATPTKMTELTRRRASAIRRAAGPLAAVNIKVWTYDCGAKEPWTADRIEKLSIEWSHRRESAIVHLDDPRLGGSTIDEYPHRVLELRAKPGFLSRFVVLPPASRLQVLVRPSQDAAYGPLSGGLTMKVVPIDRDAALGAKLQAALAYGRDGSLDELAPLATSLVQGQQAALEQLEASSTSSLEGGKPAFNLFAATLGAYLLIRTRQFAGLGTMPRELSRHAKRLPDASLLYAWQLLTAPEAYHYSEEERIGAIKEAILETAVRGMPLCAMGLRFLFERMRELLESIPAENPVRQQLSTSIFEVGKFLAASISTEQLTVFLGLNPWVPTLDRSLTPSGDNVLPLSALSRAWERRTKKSLA